MDVRFEDEDLDRLETDPNYDASLSAAIVTKFRQRMQLIRSAPDEREFYKFHALHFEKLKGKRSHQYSMRLNRQWRLIVELEGQAPNKVIGVVAIEDYH